MVFSSTVFLFLFLPIVLVGYYLIDRRFKNVFLLIASLAFYAWGEPKFVFIMMLSILANYLLGLLIDKCKNQSLAIRRIVLVIATLANLSILFYFKYFDFFISNTNFLFGLNIPLRHIVLPIGISFFTFQGMSYIFDLYMGKVPVQKNLLNIALYIALFPQLIAGPIVRYIDVNEQIVSRTHTVEKFTEGVKRFVIGLAKKIIIANMFALVAENIFATTNRSVALAWIGAIAYTIQIFFDFSGYSDMAIGLGKMFGFDFLENFNYPYISVGISDFWRRWHISLSSWFRDYVYIPLGGNRTGNVYVNLLIVFFVTGMWHGASWNFIIWGLWHGLFLIIERVIKIKNKNKEKKHKNVVLTILKWAYTMLVVIIGWVLFNSADLTSAINYIKDMFALNGNTFTDPTAKMLIVENAVIFVIAVLCSIPIAPKLKKLCNEYVVLNKAEKVVTPVLTIALFVVAVSFTVISTYNPFIYFNF